MPRDRLGIGLSLLLGAMAFLLFVGWQTLIPDNISWLQTGDRAMHQLGWTFFRHASWGIPPGTSPDLGIELSNSIGLVDGLPLLAFPFKLLGQWLPEPFQYWGYWLLLSNMLQALFAYLIARAMGAALVIALLASAFTLIAPAFAFRYPMHLALGSHWLVLAGLWLCLKPVQPRPFAWPLLLTLAASIHAYLLAMLLALWVASGVQRLLAGALTRQGAMTEVSLAALPVVFVLWASGFLMTGSLGTQGFGMYKLNLLAFFIRDRWSTIFPDIAHTQYDYEGLSFLGIGIMALLLIGLATGAWRDWRVPFERRWLPLTLMVLALALFALSDKIAFADIELVTIPLPQQVIDLFSPFRSSGRFVWPLFYLVSIGAVVLAAARLKPRPAIAIVSIAFVLQLADSAQPLTRFNRVLASSATVWTTALVSPFWDRAAAAGYDRVRGIPVQEGFGADWKEMSYYAATHDMDLDIVYLGRVDRGALDALTRKEEQAIATGDFEPKTLYVLDAATAKRIEPLLRPGDLLATIDKRIVFARGGANLVDGLGIAPRPTPGG